MTKQVLLMMKGAPATGKTTYADFWIKEAANRIRVNKDSLRVMVQGHANNLLSKEGEALIHRICDQAVQAALSAGFSVVVDNVNIAAKHERRYAAFAKQAGAAFEVKNMNLTCTLEEALERNELRDRTVPSGMIVGLHGRKQNVGH